VRFMRNKHHLQKMMERSKFWEVLTFPRTLITQLSDSMQPTD